MNDPTLIENASPAQLKPETTSPGPENPKPESLSGETISPTSSARIPNHLAAPLPGETDFDQKYSEADYDAEAEIYADARPGPEYIDRAAFAVMFAALVGAPNIALQVKGVAPLDALNVSTQTPGLREASDAFYDTCIDVPWMNFMVRPEGKWAQRAMIIGAFGMSIGNAAVMEIRERKSDAKVARSQPVNDDAMPQTSSETNGAEKREKRVDLTETVILETSAVGS